MKASKANQISGVSIIDKSVYLFTARSITDAVTLRHLCDFGPETIAHQLQDVIHKRVSPREN